MKVSVVMPTYNRAKMLPRAIDSFLAQDYYNSELIILNNGSTDNTASILKDYCFNSRIQIISVTQNIIPPNNYNLLTHEYAFGDLITHLHDDDELLPNGISLRVEAFKKDPSLQVVYAGWITNGQTYTATEPDANRILKDEYINFLTMMWKRDGVNSFLDTDLRYYHDWLFKIKCFKEYKVGYIPKPVINYSIHLGQLSIECRKLGMNGIEEQIMRNKLKEQYGII
jgi:glycosyltransferase involved in cell wall biosynthesis